jgi:DNA modification methylase
VSDFRYYIYQEDCLEVMRRAPDDYFDSMVTDPPAGISFMGREWDSNKGGRNTWVAWMSGVMKECFRVLKPGAHALVWAIPRTSHWTATALEDAGFEVRDVCTHHYGSGFPKSRDIGKDIQSWVGWGTALKPATEHWILVRKPLSESSIAKNVLKWGTGALNIDACRVHRDAGDVPGWHKTGAKGSAGYRSERCAHCDGEDNSEDCDFCGGTGIAKGTFVIRDMTAEEVQERCGDKGRWPTNLLLTHAADCDEVCCCEDCPIYELDRQSGQSRSTSAPRHNSAEAHNRTSSMGKSSGDWISAGHTDSGGASRFFPTFRYQAKPSRSERERGLDALEASTLNRVNPGGIENDPRWAPVTVKNNHPTVKSSKLMAWLCRLITPPGGLVLDPFCGSGSTGVACMAEGFRFVGVDQDEHYCQIAQARVECAANETNEATHEDLSLTEAELAE